MTRWFHVLAKSCAILHAYVRNPNSNLRSLQSLCSTRQREEKLEEDYRQPFNVAIHRCLNAHEDDEKITIYIDGFSTKILTMFDRYHERTPRCELHFEEFPHFAEYEEDSVCERSV